MSRHAPFMKKCEYCDTDFLAHVGRIAKGKDRYCSRHCASEASKTSPTQICLSCGLPFLAKASEVAKNWGKFCSRTCQGKNRFAKESNPRWKGGRYIINGYVILNTPDGRILEHRFILEQHLGRKLRLDEVVHHINENKTDNRLENLLLTTRQKHIDFHHIKKWARKHDCCSECGTSQTPHAARGLCDNCYVRASTARRGNRC
jgi:hypothetical protein